MADLWAAHGGEVGQKGPLASTDSHAAPSAKCYRAGPKTLIADAAARHGTMATVTKAIARMGLIEDLDIVERSIQIKTWRASKESSLRISSQAAGVRTRHRRARPLL